MAVKPRSVTLSKSDGPSILNAIRNEIGGEYKETVPYATGTLENLRDIGAAILNYTPNKNAFLDSLINRIAFVVINSKLYENPWAFLKRGFFEYGETIEEVVTNLIDPYAYQPDGDPGKVFKRYIPDVRAAFHPTNYKVYYPVTISYSQLKQAFLNYSELDKLYTGIIQSVRSSANYDEFLVMKYMIAKAILNGAIKVEGMPASTATDGNSQVVAIKTISNLLPYMSTEYNYAGVNTFTEKEDQYVLLAADFDAAIDVEVLASAFNMDKVEFMGRRVQLDGFDKVNNERLSLLLKDNHPGYTPLTSDEIEALKNIKCVILDRDWFMIYDNLVEMGEEYNPVDLSRNYFYHNWKTFSYSPFKNAVAFSIDTPTISSVEITPSTAAITKPGTQQFEATVTGTGLFDKDVTWSISTNTDSNITSDGLLTVGSNETQESITVTAACVGDKTKSATVTVTIR